MNFRFIEFSSKMLYLEAIAAKHLFEIRGDYFRPVLYVNELRKR